MTPDWIKTAKVGDRVVCIDGEWPETALDNSETRYESLRAHRIPMVNEVLTISGIRGGKSWATAHIVWLYFEEIGDEFGFISDQFRPLNDRPTDISIFTDILKKASKPIEECV